MSLFIFTLRCHEAALADYGLAIDLDPNYGVAYYNRGNTNANLGRHKEALTDYGRAIDLNPNDANAYVGIGALLGNSGALREALPYFEKAAQLGDQTGAQYAADVRQRLKSASS